MLNKRQHEDAEKAEYDKISTSVQKLAKDGAKPEEVLRSVQTILKDAYKLKPEKMAKLLRNAATTEKVLQNKDSR